MSIWALHDHDEKLKKRGAFNLTQKYMDIRNVGDIAERGNKKGYGIFWVVNEMKDENGERKVENLKRINYWYCDIDEGTKADQKKRIKDLVINPSFAIETQKGYHCYWGVKGTATLENFKLIEGALIEKLNGDKHCKDVLRLLRCPGYYHMKNPQKPFLCQIVDGFGTDKAYTEEQMLACFVDKKEKDKETRPQKRYIDNSKADLLNPEKWEKIFKPHDIVSGCRNSMLTRYAYWMIDEGVGDANVAYIIRGLNDMLACPLSKEEVNSILRGRRIYA